MSQIPNDTDWNSQEACLDTFIRNYHKYVEIDSEQSLAKVDPHISRLFNNNSGLFYEILNFHKQLKLVAIVLNDLQSNSANISTAIKIWKFYTTQNFNHT